MAKTMRMPPHPRLSLRELVPLSHHRQTRVLRYHRLIRASLEILVRWLPGMDEPWDLISHEEAASVELEGIRHSTTVPSRLLSWLTCVFPSACNAGYHVVHSDDDHRLTRDPK